MTVRYRDVVFARLPRLLVAAPLLLLWAVGSAWLVGGAADGLWIDFLHTHREEEAEWDCTFLLHATQTAARGLGPGDLQSKLGRKNRFRWCGGFGPR